jgi:alkanesulfonate monooxygenase SsuD/methylene tetrahydromethanopterin reductase-like flavin-dependent oxidoreductase (luciferase family)
MLARMTLIGLSLLPRADQAADLLRLARRAEELEYDLLAIQDHPYEPSFLDAMALLSVVLGATTRLAVLPDVAVLPLRPPAMLAKTAMSLDRLTDGRFILGVGAGGIRDAIPRMGGPTLTAKDAVDAFAEAAELLHGLWASGPEPYTFNGVHHRVAGLALGPVGTRPRLWVGAHGPRMLKLVARYADGWVPSLFRGRTPEILKAAAEQLDEAVAAAGRDPGDVRHVWNVGVQISDGGSGPGAPAEAWVERLRTWRGSYGATDFVIWPGGEDLDDQLERFAADVRPYL